jgi:hypothetical protein
LRKRGSREGKKGKKTRENEVQKWEKRTKIRKDTKPLHILQGEQKVSVHLMITLPKKKKKKKIFLIVSITYHDNVVSILNTVFENTVRRVNKCLETGGGHFEHYL